jgi:GDPmannose 4,6-dehydratase
MWRMLQQENPDDYVIATGESYSLQDFVQQVFAELKLNWRDHVHSNEQLLRPADIAEGRGNAFKAAKRLGWQAQWRMPQVVVGMVSAELALLSEAG